MEQAAQIWTLKAAERGDASAMLTYGAMFLEGKAMTRSDKHVCACVRVCMCMQVLESFLHIAKSKYL
jgi:TPR repeat protein